MQISKALPLILVSLNANAELPHNFQSGSPARAAEVNANFGYLNTEIQGVRTSASELSDIVDSIDEKVTVNKTSIDSLNIQIDGMSQDVQSNILNLNDLLTELAMLKGKVESLENATPSAPAFRLLNADGVELAVNAPEQGGNVFHLFTDRSYYYASFDRESHSEPRAKEISINYMTSDCTGTGYVYYQTQLDMNDIITDDKLQSNVLSHDFNTAFYIWTGNTLSNFTPLYTYDWSGACIAYTGLTAGFREVIPATTENTGFDPSLLVPPYKVEYK